MKNILAVLAALATATVLADNVNLISGRSFTVTTENRYQSNNTETFANAVNGNVTDRCIWKKPNLGTGVIPRGIISFTDGKLTVNAYRIYEPSSALAANRMPKTWTFSGRNAGDENWTLLDTQTDITGWVPGSYKDFSFRNVKPFSEFMIEITANNGDGSIVGMSEIEFYQVEQTDLLEIGYTGYEVGNPIPAYGPVDGLSAGYTTNLTVVSPFYVDSTTSELYLLDGFTLTDFSGNEIASGTADDLPYAYTHSGHAKFYWNWVSQTKILLASLEDQTVPYNAEKNEITANHYESTDIPKNAFDNNLQTRWRSQVPTAQSPVWLQYHFLDGARIITGFKFNYCTKYGPAARLPNTFIFQGSNDGENFDDLLIVAVVNQARDVENTRFIVNNSTPYQYYRFYMTGGGSSWLEIGNIELYSHYSANTLRIIGKPGAFGEPEPGYGFNTDLVGGTTYTLTAPSAQIIVSDDEKTVATAYRLSLNGVQGNVVNGTSCSYTHVDGDYGVLEWIFSGTYRQSFSVSGGGNVSQNEVWAADGQSVTVTASVGANDAAFAMWSGDLPDGIDATDPELTYTADRPRHITANFAAPLYVKPDGNDNADGTSAATALATLTNAFARVTNGGAINVLPGTYAIPGNALDIGISLAFKATDGNPANTIIELENEGAGSLLSVNHAGATVNGFTFRGATDTGLKVADGVIANCVIEDCATTGNVGGLHLAGGTVTNCVFRNNTANGYAGGVLIASGAVPVVFDDNIITGNTAKTAITDSCAGGGIVIIRSFTVNRLVIAENAGSGAYLSGTTVLDSLFENNKSTSGGRGAGAYLNNSACVERCVLRGNHAGSFGGGAFVESGNLINDLFDGNYGSGGGIFSRGNTTMKNCSFINNTGSSKATDMRTSGTFACRNCLFSGTISGLDNDMSTATNFMNSARNCCFVNQELTETSLSKGNITTDNPRVDANGRIRSASSPLVNAGDNWDWTEDDIDLYGNRRIFNFGTKHGIVDIGCCESVFDKSKGIRLMLQ